MTRISLAAALCALTLSAPAKAQSDAEIQPGEQVDAAEWRELTIGRTVYYRRFGKFYGAETYDPDGSTVYWRTPQGECVQGVLTVEGSVDPVYCFAWEGWPVWCGRHYRTPEGDLVARGLAEDGSLDPLEEPHWIMAIDSKNQPCRPPGVSMAPTRPQHHPS